MQSTPGSIKYIFKKELFRIKVLHWVTVASPLTSTYTPFIVEDEFYDYLKPTKKAYL